MAEKRYFPHAVPFYYHLASKHDLCQDAGDASLADDRVLDDRTTITVEFDYPLSRPVQINLAGISPWTRAIFARAVAEQYARMYADEADAINKCRDLPYGIVGHALSDLVLESANRTPDGVWHLTVGS